MRDPAPRPTPTKMTDEENPIDRLDTSKIHIDTSVFHPLMHRPFTRECRELPGGSRNHIKLWWQYRGELMLREYTSCKLGLHEPTKWWRRDNPKPEIRCHNCYKRLDEE